GAHLPTQYSDNARGIVRIKHHVVELEVVMHKRGWASRFGIGLGWNALGQPFNHTIDCFELACFRALPSFGPAFYLPRDKSHGFADVHQTRRININRMKLGQRVDHSLTHSPAKIKIVADLFGDIPADNQTSSAFHKIKRDTDYGRVFAKQVRTRRARKQRMHSRKQPKFARHVVSRWGDGSKWRPPQNKLVPAKPNQIRQIRMPARKLLDFNSSRIQRRLRKQL